MQQQFIANFNELRANQAKRGLLISATGTGKTYAAAFTMREMNPKRILFFSAPRTNSKTGNGKF